MSRELDPKPQSEAVLKSETLVYIAILALAAFVRLYRLGQAPLSADEAAQALAAWRGTPPPPGASPVLYAINSVLFALLGPGDGLARLGAALLGVALVGVPVLLRHRLGRAGALGAAFVLAISPTAIVASRTLSGEIITALAGLGGLAACDCYVQASGRGQANAARWMDLSAAAFALGLMGGSSFYTLALILAGGLAFWTAFGQRPTIALDWRRAAIIVVVGVVGVSTAFLWRPAGLAAVGDLLAAWLRGFGLDAGITWWYLPFQVLGFYEGLALLVGLTGLSIALLRGERLGIFLGYWALAAVLVIALRQGRTPQDTVIAVVPLACLAGYVAEALADSFRRWRLSSLEVAFVAVLLAIIAFGLLGLADYAVNPGAIQSFGPAERPLTLHRAAVQGLLAVTLLAIVVLLLVSLVGAEPALRGSVLAVLVVLTLGAWAAGWGATQVHLGDPRELVGHPQPTSLSLRLMVNTLQIASAQQTGDLYALPLVVVQQSSGDDDVLAWTLRDFRNVQFVSALDERAAPQVVIAPYGATPALASSYAGQDFAVRTTWSWAGHAGADSLRWLLYRWSPDAPLAESRVVVWVRQEQLKP